jgi:hypothetical protein
MNDEDQAHEACFRPEKIRSKVTSYIIVLNYGSIFINVRFYFYTGLHCDYIPDHTDVCWSSSFRLPVLPSET